MNKGKGNLEKLQVGDEVWLSSRNIGTAHLKQKCAKLQPRFLGPYRISEEKTANTFKLVLPKSMGRLHPVFHRAELLWKDIPVLEELENRMELDDPPLDIQMEQEDLLGTTGGVQMDIIEEMSDEDIEDLEEDISVPPVIPFLNAKGNEYIPVEKLVDRRDKGESHEYLVKFVSGISRRGKCLGT